MLEQSAWADVEVTTQEFGHPIGEQFSSDLEWISPRRSILGVSYLSRCVPGYVQGELRGYGEVPEVGLGSVKLVSEAGQSAMRIAILVRLDGRGVAVRHCGDSDS